MGSGPPVGTLHGDGDLVFAIAAYHGTVALTTPAIYVVTATGPWTMIAS